MRKTTLNTPKSGKCRICREPTTQKHGLIYSCSIEHTIEFINRAKAKKLAKEKRDERKKLVVEKERIKSLATLCADTRKVVQKYARLRDAKWGTCICCGVGRIDDGAHYFSVGSKYRCSRLSLDARIIHGACDKCNRFTGGGNILGYQKGLIQRYGPAILDELEELKRKADSGEDTPLTKEEVKKIKSYFNQLCREIINH